MTDAQIIQWLEAMHTLHRLVEVLYVVDGFEVTVTWDGMPLHGPFKAETLREAYVMAANAVKP
jgi:hypothetical protein